MFDNLNTQPRLSKAVGRLMQFEPIISMSSDEKSSLIDDVYLAEDGLTSLNDSHFKVVMAAIATVKKKDLEGEDND